MQTDNITLVVETKDGRPLRTFQHEGKTFIESRENSEYQIRVKNKTNKRVMAVIAVDGINVVSGKIASDKPTETGYVLGPYEEHVIKGYRIDETNVASFKFVKREEGYAQEKGNGAGSGVIALRAWAEKGEDEEQKRKRLEELFEKWKEKEDDKKKDRYIPYPMPYPVYPSYPSYPPYDTSPWWRYPYRPFEIWYSHGDVVLCSSSTHANGSAMGLAGAMGSLNSSAGQTCQGIAASNLVSSTTASNLSSTSNPFAHASSWGSEAKDAVREVSFEPGDLLAEINVFYAPREGLKELGIDIEKTKAVAFPEPFKREYCSPPKSWTGHKG